MRHRVFCCDIHTTYDWFWCFAFLKKDQKNKKENFMTIVLSCKKSELRVINRINAVNAYEYRNAKQMRISKF
jgi:hypothetical protein